MASEYAEHAEVDEKARSTKTLDRQKDMETSLFFSS
jgi:hypothetical protein